MVQGRGGRAAGGRGLREGRGARRSADCIPLSPDGTGDSAGKRRVGIEGFQAQSLWLLGQGAGSLGEE